TAFTYQGRLSSGTNTANGLYDLTFSLFAVSSGGSAIGVPLTNSAGAISNGLFTVTLDFGANFPGADRWLEIGVRTNGNVAFTTLSPRQKISPTPYALYSLNASVSATANNIAAGAVLNPVNAANLTNLNATQLAAGSALPPLDGQNLTNLLTDTRDFSVNLD